MTPASSDRYQSRLFRFVYKQSRRLTQQCDRAWRNLQSTASWVAAVGLYPLLLLLQSRRSTANQVHQAVEETLRQLPADDAGIPEESPTVDTPIRQVLLYVTEATERQKSKACPRAKRRVKSQKLGFVEAGVQKSKVRSQNSEVFHATTNYQLPSRSVALASTTDRQLPITTHSIRGIASQLSNRSLVLVTAQNQTLDVLDPQQQESLQAEIMNAVARYWQYRRSQNQSLTPSPWLTSLDHTVAEVESHHLVRVKSTAIAFYQSIFSQTAELTDSKRPTAEVQTEPSSKTHRTAKILSLIWAAIDYFFGTDDRATHHMPSGTSRNRANPRLIGKSTPGKPRFTPSRPTARLPASHNSADEDLADPWLTTSDLFGAAAQETTHRPITTIALPANPAADCAIPQKREGLRQLLSKIRAPQGIVKRRYSAGDSPNLAPQGGQQSTSQVSQLQTATDERISPPNSQRGHGEIGAGAKGKQTLQKAKTNRISTSTSKTSSVQAKPDWIETPATLIGYVKHPLEQILAWLDRVMLWLEESIVKFWQWMQKIWHQL
jgi:hypothetical protein